MRKRVFHTLITIFIGVGFALCGCGLLCLADDGAGSGVGKEDVKKGSRRELLLELQDTGVVPVALSASMLYLEKAGGNDFPNSFDYSFRSPGGASVRVYRTHAERKTVAQGVDIVKERGAGQYRLLGVGTFETSPLLEGAVGVKYSKVYMRRKTTYALVSLPRINDGYEFNGLSKYMLAYSYNGQGGDHKLLDGGGVRVGWRRRDTMFVSFLGESPAMDGMLELKNTFELTAEGAGVLGVKPYLRVWQGMDWSEAVSMMLWMPGRSAADVLNVLDNNRGAAAGFYAELPNGFRVRYGFETNKNFDKRVESVSVRGRVGKDYEIAVLYDKDRGYMSFYRPWEKRRTRLQLTRVVGKLSYGLFAELRPDDRIFGVSVGADAGEARAAIVPKSNYRAPYKDSRASVNFNFGHNLCGVFGTFGQAVEGMTTPEEVSDFSNCLNYGGSVDDNPVTRTPEEIFGGAEANCQSTSWLQAKILAGHGYETYVVGFQGTKTQTSRDERFSVYHAVAAYRDKDTMTWNIIDYNTILKTDAKTIQEALEVYDPNHSGYVVKEPGELRWLGSYANPAFQTVKDWIVEKND